MNEFIDNFNPNKFVNHTKAETYYENVFMYDLLDASSILNKNFEEKNLNGVLYNKNSLGYRSSEFTGKEEVLIAGCSFTFGLGLSIENTWPYFLSKMMNKEYANVAYMGLGIDEIVMNIINYCEKYGSPEYIFCLFPPLHRFYLPNTEMLMNNASLNEFKNEDRIIPMSKVNINEDLKKTSFFKTPISQEELISWEIPYYFNIRQIHILESFCKAKNIKLKWSIWFYKSDMFIDMLQNMTGQGFNNYIKNTESMKNASELQYSFRSVLEKDKSLMKKYEVGYDDPSLHAKIFKKMDMSDIKCHKDLYEKNISEFIIAKDFAYGFDAIHPGSHFQVHVAENFYNNLEE